MKGKLMVCALAAGLCTLHAGDIGKLELGGYAENTFSVLADDVGRLSEHVLVRAEGTWDLGDKAGLEVHALLGAAWQPLDPFAGMKDGSLIAGLAQEFMGGMLMELMGGLDSASQALLGGMTGAAGDDEMLELLNYLPYSSLYPADNVAMDRVLVKLYLKRMDLFLGRQMIAWGTGYAFNPTDVWNLKNPLDPTAPKQGVFALRAEIPFGALSGVSLVLAPGADLQHSSGGVRVKTNLAGYDLSVSAIKVMNADRVLYQAPPLVMAGADMAGQIGDVGIWAEVAGVNPKYDSLEYTDFDEAYVQADAGLDYTFENGLYVMAEYFFNGLGQDSYKDYSVVDLVNMTNGDMPGFGKHYVMLGTNKEIVAGTTLGLFGLVNAVDQSAMLLPSVEYAFSPDAVINVNGQIGVGDTKKSEYGSVYSSVVMKVTGYF